LPNRRTLGKQNPYCIARVGQDAKRCPTDVRGGQVPSWDHEVRFEVMDVFDQKTLKLSVLDENDFKPELIGDTIIKLDKAFTSHPSQGYDEWHELQFKGKYAGEVYLEMTFYQAKPAVPPKKNSTPKLKQHKSSQAIPFHPTTHQLPVAPSDGTRPLPLEPGQTPRPLPYPESEPMGPMVPDPWRSLNSSGSSTSSRHSRHELPVIPAPKHAHSMPHLPQEHFMLAVPQERQLIPSLPPAPPRHTSPLPSQTRQNISPSPPIGQPPVLSPMPVGPLKRKPVGSSPRRKPVASPDTSPSEKQTMPFSADSYSQQPVQPPPQGRDDVLDLMTYAPEPVFKNKTLPRPPGAVEPGAGGYAGAGQWDISKQINDGYGQSIFNKVTKSKIPELPPKIPLGMTREEYAATQPVGDDEPYYYVDRI
jgi:hypothetical protein